MTKVIVRHRLVTWFKEVEDAFSPSGKNRTEQLAHMGDEVDIPDDEIKRLESVNTPKDPPFYTDEHAEQIRQGTYRGFDSEALSRMRAGQRPANAIEPIEDEGPQVQNLSTEELAEYISENKLNVDQTVALAGDDLESIEKVLDAESIATDSEPRTGVVKRLEAKLNALTS